MSQPIEIKKGIYWVGVVDWTVRSFHGHTYSTPRGTTYNAYLIVDDKIALVDTVFAAFGSEMMAKIRGIVDPAKIDYVIANHVETDHSGALPQLLKLCPKAKVFGTQKCQEGLYKYYYCDLNFQIVKTGDTLKLGKRTLTFIEAPMVHWPDSMFTYCREEELLLPNDAFGQHYASSQRFNDQVDNCELMDEAKKYYANILWPLGSMISRKIEEVLKLNLPVSMIAPSHGIIWRKDPLEIVKAYQGWARQETVAKVIVVYETMWNSTQKMARLITDELIAGGLEVKLYDVNNADRTDIFKEMLDAKGFLFGSSTHDNNMLPNLAGFLALLKGFKAKGRVAGVFGSYGWAAGAVKEIEELLKAAGIEVAVNSCSAKFVPDDKESADCLRFAADFAAKVK
ncbi:MAG: flavodoxin domain-containing protein [Candidatus Omnitrophica bacterium]|nr:flavodoxin domain-containing protein [Candidatus Omnitrophota bacterium]